MREQPFDESILDATETEIKRQLHSLEGAQASLKETLKGKSILIIDTLAGGHRLAREGLQKLQEKGGGYEKLAQIYLEHMFGGRLPQNVTDMFRNFLGDSVNLVTRDIRENSTNSPQEISGVIFAGSPADVTKGLNNELKNNEVRTGAGITHGEVLKRATTLYREAAAQNLPVLGICYGHQMISLANEGQVVRTPGREENGLSQIKTNGEYGNDLLAGVFGNNFDPTSLQGNIAAYHSEEVIPNQDRSALILRTSDMDPQIVHGLMHITDGKFSGKGQQDTELVKQLLADGRHAALTVQGHPEETLAQRIITFAITEDPNIFKKEGDDAITADMLHMFDRFLAIHKKTKET